MARIYKFKVSNRLVIKKLWSVVDGKEKRPKCDEDKEAAYDDGDREAFTVINNLVVDDIISRGRCRDFSRSLGCMRLFMWQNALKGAWYINLVLKCHWAHATQKGVVCYIR